MPKRELMEFGCALSGGTAVNQSGDPWWPVITMFGVLPVVVILIGVGFIIFGGVGVLAGVGVLRRKRWARGLTIVLAGLVLLSCGAVLADTSGLTAVDVITTVAQAGYGVFALVALARHGAEFRRPPSGPP